MKYFVTYATFDDSIANPMWHSFLMLSTGEEGKQLKVYDNWGFYGVPSTNRNDIFSSIKIQFGLDIDLTDNHGMLRHEQIRSLDMGKGVHGITFELTEEQFFILEDRCKKQASLQQQAIDDYTKGIKGKSPKSTRLYPQEAMSKQIYRLEKTRAHEAN